eukprot:TRINITY_DN13677_c0_g2_i2.p1 TRINITY_DN13677_c0_g2~~TRINITY_DN13677_c0_g2_i2.p1  ORF type:complete len:159 (+),score=39.09 TRINITY_DN13677_c0_g2_i2:142-618(+)
MAMNQVTAQQELEVRNKMWEERYQQVVAESNRRVGRLTEQLGILSSEVSDTMMERAMCKMELAEKLKEYLMHNQFQGYTSVYGLIEATNTLVKGGEKQQTTRKRNVDGENIPTPTPPPALSRKRVLSDEPMDEDAEQPFTPLETPMAKRRPFAVSTPC